MKLYIPFSFSEGDKGLQRKEYLCNLLKITKILSIEKWDRSITYGEMEKWKIEWNIKGFMDNIFEIVPILLKFLQSYKFEFNGSICIDEISFSFMNRIKGNKLIQEIKVRYYGDAEDDIYPKYSFREFIPLNIESEKL